jgi:hypothetical protein
MFNGNLSHLQPSPSLFVAYHHTGSHGTGTYTKEVPTVEDSTATHAKEASTVEATTYCSFKGNQTNRILLATAIVEVRNKANPYFPCRILLDSGSKLYFVTERCVQKLRLSKSQTPTHVQGINNANTSTHRCSHPPTFENLRLACYNYMCSAANHYKFYSSLHTGHSHGTFRQISS